MNPELEKVLQKSWDSTCKIVLGREIGPIGKYREWLSSHLPKRATRKSAASGKEVILALDSYPAKSRFLSADEVVQNHPYRLGINQIKDIDSIVSGIGEQLEYTGNKILGNSAFVEDSDIVISSQYVNNSANIEESAYMDSSFMVRKGSKYGFGSGYFGKSEFLIRVVGTFNTKRSFESYFIPDSADVYFSHNCFGSHDLMFCFGQRAAGYRIGNLQLPKEKYHQLKAKIMGEVADELEKKGSFPTLPELVPVSLPEKLPQIAKAVNKDRKDMGVIEKGFASTMGVVLKVKPSSIRDYEEWLTRDTGRVGESRTAFGSVTYYPMDFPGHSDFAPKRRVTFDELMELGKLSLGASEVESLGAIRKNIGKVGYFSSELYDGEISNCIDTPLSYHGSNAFKTYDITYGEHAGLCFLALNSKYTYGCRRILESQFSVKCYNSLYLNRCFEMDSCNKCADSYFCHNSEGLSDCMFCFNFKGMRHAIGNNQLSKEKYASVKEAVLGQIGQEISKTHGLRMNIFNIAAGRK